MEMYSSLNLLWHLPLVIIVVLNVVILAQAAGRSRLLRPGQANFVFWGRLLQGGHVCPENLREFMVSFLTYIS